MTGISLNAEWAQALQTVNQVLAQRERDLAAAELSLADASRVLADKDVALNDLKAVVATAQADFNGLLQALAERDGELAALRMQLEQRPTEGELAAASATITQLTDELSRAQADATQLRQSLSAREVELHDMTTALGAETQKLRDKAAAIASLQHEHAAAHEAARQRAQQDQERLDALDAELGTLRAASQARAEELVQRLRATEKHRDALGRALDEARLDSSRRDAEAALQIQQLRVRAQQYLLGLRALRRTQQQQASAAQRLHLNQLLAVNGHADGLRQALADREVTLRDLQRLATESSGAHAEIVRLLSEQLLRAQQQAMAQADADQASLARIQGELVRERAEAMRQLNQLRDTVSAMAEHWTWRWTRWIRRADGVRAWRNRRGDERPGPSVDELVAPSLAAPRSNHNTSTLPNETHMDGTKPTDMQRSAPTVQDSSARVRRTASPAARVDELLLLHDQAFIEASYFSLLGRAPDATGRAIYLSQLRLGRSRESIIAAIARSPECRSKAPTLAGLKALVRSERRGPIWLWKRFVSNWMHAPGTRGDDLVRRAANDVMRSIDRISDQIDSLESRMAGMESRLASVVESSLRSTAMAETPPTQPTAGVTPPRTPVPMPSISVDQEQLFERVRQMLTNGHEKEPT